MRTVVPSPFFLVYVCYMAMLSYACNMSNGTEKPLDAGIERAVSVLRTGGVETFESCEGGEGHPFPEPTIRFHGDGSEGFRALAIAQQNGLQVDQLRRYYQVQD